MSFRTELGKTIFEQKYANYPGQTWEEKSQQLADIMYHVTGNIALMQEAHEAINAMKFMPGGRYIYYAGKPAKFYNNCFLFKSQEDTRECWADLTYDVTSSLMSGGGVGNDYSVFRASGTKLGRTGGEASGPIPLMMMSNEIGRNVMQGGSRRSALYASLNWRHGDIWKFLKAKNWEDQIIQGAFDKDGNPFTVKMAKEADFNYPAPLDMTNISVNYDNEFAQYCITNNDLPEVFIQNIRQAMMNGEPGMSFNFGDKENETARNACTEVTSEDDGDVCNIGSVNMARIETLAEFAQVVEIGTKFLMCGLIDGELPNDKIKKIRKKNQRIGLGLMGIHEWLLQRGYKYEVTPELKQWLEVYRDVTDSVAASFAIELGINEPVAKRSIAPTGTIGILAGTTTGLEPIFAVAYKRRFLVGGNQWHYQYCVDATAEAIITSTGIDPDAIETALDLAKDAERRIKFQADIQDYVDMAISSTLNLPAWGTELNCEERVEDMARLVAKYALRLRGLTFYPDGSRGGQPLSAVPYAEAKGMEGLTFEENDNCKTGVCGF